MRYLVTGGSGKLGTHLCPTIDCLAPSRTELDILNVGQIEKYASREEVDTILHLAAFCDVNATEKDKPLTYRINVQGTRNVAEAAEKFNKKIVYISTDYVFPCTAGGYKETDQPNPFSWYGFTKYAGELEIQSKVDNHLIIRTSFRPSIWPFPTAYSNVFTSADYVDIIADEIALCLNKATDLTGVIHIGTPIKTMYELAKKRNPGVLPEEFTGTYKKRDFSLEKWEKIKKSLLD